MPQLQDGLAKGDVGAVKSLLETPGVVFLKPSCGRFISPIGWTVILDSPELARILVGDGRFSIRDSIKPEESAVPFAIRKGASLALVDQLLQHPDLKPQELQAMLVGVSRSIYSDVRYQRALCRALKSKVTRPLQVKLPGAWSSWKTALFNLVRRLDL